MEIERDMPECEVETKETLMQKLMPDFDKYFEVEQEDQKQAKYAWDALHPL